MMVGAFSASRSLWRVDLPDAEFGFSAATGAPAVVNGSVVLSNVDGTIHAFDRLAGSSLWSLPPVRMGGRAGLRSVVRAGELLVSGSETGLITAYRTEDHSIAWQCGSGYGSRTWKLVAADGHVYVPYLSGTVAAYDVASGRVVWAVGGPSDMFMWGVALHGPNVLSAGKRDSFE